ncbi:MAG: flagellar hook-length control protein FliK [Anaerolineae bacterium]|nr:flagellar hook-length control protein FliK [Anaerolineae bacterium]
MDVKALSSMLSQQIKSDIKVSSKTDENIETEFGQLLQTFVGKINDLPVEQENLLATNVGSIWLQLLLTPFNQKLGELAPDLPVSLNAGEKEEGKNEEIVSVSLTEIMAALQPLISQSNMPLLSLPDGSSDEIIDFDVAVANEINNLNTSSFLGGLTVVPQVEDMPVSYNENEAEQQPLSTANTLFSEILGVANPENKSGNQLQTRGGPVGSFQVTQMSNTLQPSEDIVTNVTPTIVDGVESSQNYQLSHNIVLVPDEVPSQSHTSPPTELPTMIPQPMTSPPIVPLSGSQLVNAESIPTVRLPDIPALHQITDSIGILTQPGQTEVRLHLQPETLGHLLVQLHIADGNVAVRMFAETPQAQALIQEHLNQLKLAFANQGLQIDGLSVTVGQNNSAFDMLGQRSNNGSNGTNSHQPYFSFDEIEETSESRRTTNMWGILRVVDYQV